MLRMCRTMAPKFGKVMVVSSGMVQVTDGGAVR